MSKKLIYLVSFVLVLSAAGNASADLLVHWAFEEGSGTTAFDTSGNGRDGTFTGEPQWVAGHNSAGALHFDGVDDFVSHSLPGDQTYAAFTIAVWAKADGVDQADLAAVFASRFPGGATGAGFQIDLTTQVTPQVYQIRPNTGSGVFGNATTDWVHLAVVCEGTSAQLYYQGAPTNKATLVSSLFNEFTVGVNRARSRFFAGTIDELCVYDHALSEVEILGAMAGEIFPYAFGPEPADGTLHEDTWANISWKPGGFAVSHDVYLGDNFDDVDAGAEGTFLGNQATTKLIVGFPGFPYPDGLVPDTTYYWRIDEVNDADPNSPWKGDVWSFSIPPKSAYFPEPADGAESVDVDVQLSWTGGFGAKLHTVYFGENFNEVNNAAGGLPQGSATYTPSPLEMAKTYYWRVDEFDIIETHKGDVWSFTTQGAVGDPNPANGAVDVKQTQIITFSPSVYAASHQLYFGTDEDAVKNADTGSPEYKGTRDLGSESYDPGMLLWDTTYYWRIDEVNDASPDSPWPGILWSFTTANFLVVDDFEDYDASENQIWYAWHDGLGYGTPGTDGYYAGNETGSAVGDESTPSYTEETIVHGGNQSMPVFYDNSVLLYSEVEKTLTYPRDWTENGVTTLSIWFRGISANAAETLYVALNGNAIVTNDNPDAAQINKW
ncbi:MAG: LamG domain-containing protein, partial [Phycisphaerae bacterium]